jgi:hypothetical protein
MRPWVKTSVLNHLQKKKEVISNLLGMVAQACNPSYSEGRDQEDHGSKPGGANSSWDPISKNSNNNNRLKV